eukprot:5417017-Alexandrium_andersonii.AAC.1
MQVANTAQDNLLPDQNEIEPEGAVDVGSEGYPPTPPPGLERARGQPQPAAQRQGQERGPAGAAPIRALQLEPGQAQ